LAQLKHGGSMFRDILEYCGYLFVVVIIFGIIHVIDAGPQHVAFEIGQTVSAFKAGVSEGSAIGISNFSKLQPDVGNNKQ
jgi:hypothetical protein